jgi:hypothetical protein
MIAGSSVLSLLPSSFFLPLHQSLAIASVSPLNTAVDNLVRKGPPLRLRNFPTIFQGE